MKKIILTAIVLLSAYFSPVEAADLSFAADQKYDVYVQVVDTQLYRLKSVGISGYKTIGEETFLVVTLESPQPKEEAYVAIESVKLITPEGYKAFIEVK